MHEQGRIILSNQLGSRSYCTRFCWWISIIIILKNIWLTIQSFDTRLAFQNMNMLTSSVISIGLSLNPSIDFDPVFIPFCPPSSLFIEGNDRLCIVFITPQFRLNSLTWMFPVYFAASFFISRIIVTLPNSGRLRICILYVSNSHKLYLQCRGSPELI